ncbi:response regulator [Novosphingobium sp. NBM11]|uniref:response regulator transcription factor n=1 Tax=Novosphingobium sp. NBM11 TaxID=2596914 RepID=UPI0028152533|nr:response regulator [Novosphingobium sp. NBM11]
MVAVHISGPSGFLREQAGPEIMRLRNKVIAVIDDDARVRASTASLLRSLGYAAMAYASVEDFLGSTETAIDCVLTDLQMPGLTGLDLGAALRERGASVPVILMTAFPSPGVRAKARMLKMAGFLEKPLHPDRLLDVLRQALPA